MSKETFARETRMNITEAEEFVESFYRTFPIMTEYLNEIKRCVVQSGLVQSIYGRRLYFDLNQSKSNEMSKARVIEEFTFFFINFFCVKRSNDKRSIL
jgi:DNA polymerase I-like protein with 3'-5' exonuclease and polymerase domains